MQGRLLEKILVLLQKSWLTFIGFIEGNEACKNKVDVVVIDSFSGNIFKDGSGNTGFIGKAAAFLLKSI